MSKKNNYNEIAISKEPKILLITPLRKNDNISQETFNSIIQKNDISFDWISFASKNNPVINCNKAINHYQRKKSLPKYIMKLDNDITADPGWLIAMYNTLENSNDNIAYAYTAFEYYGNMNIKFPVKDFDPKHLKQCNYISFNSLIKTQCLLDIGGFVDLEGQDRLWDWTLWLKFLCYNYIGKPVADVKFRAFASKNSISCGSKENYYKNYLIVKKEFDL